MLIIELHIFISFDFCCSTGHSSSCMPHKVFFFFFVFMYRGI